MTVCLVLAVVTRSHDEHSCQGSGKWKRRVVAGREPHFWRSFGFAQLKIQDTRPPPRPSCRTLDQSQHRVENPKQTKPLRAEKLHSTISNRRLQECALRPGTKIRVCAPDLDTLSTPKVSTLACLEGNKLQASRRSTRNSGRREGCHSFECHCAAYAGVVRATV